MLTNCELKVYIGIFATLLIGSTLCLLFGVYYVINNYIDITIICFYLLGNIMLLDFILIFVIMIALEELRLRKNNYKLQLARRMLHENFQK